MLSEIVDYRVTSGKERRQNTRSFLTPYMVSCSVADAAYPPEAVSLVPFGSLKQRACFEQDFFIPTNCLQVGKKMEGMYHCYAQLFINEYYASCSFSNSVTEWLTHTFPDDEVMRSQSGPRLAVCVKGIFYPDPSAVPRLVEWLELQSILGVEKVFLHYISLSFEAMTMLRHYEQRGLVVLKEFVWTGPYLRYHSGA